MNYKLLDTDSKIQSRSFCNGFQFFSIYCRPLPGWKEWTFCNGLAIASRITWFKFWSIYAELSDNATLNLTPCSGGLILSNFRLDMKYMKTLPKYNLPKNKQIECTNFLYAVITRNPANNLTRTLNDLEEYM